MIKWFNLKYKGSVLKARATENNTTIFDSHIVKSFSGMRSLIYYMRGNAPKEYAIRRRSVTGMIHEWRVHNLLYELGLFRSRTKDVDLNTDQSWYAKVLYFIISPLYFHFS